MNARTTLAQLFSHHSLAKIGRGSRRASDLNHAWQQAPEETFHGEGHCKRNLSSSSARDPRNPHAPPDSHLST